MEKKIELDRCYVISDDVVAKEVEGKIIIIPLVAGMGSIETELYTLNATGKYFWKKLDGKTPLQDVIKKISNEYDAPLVQIEHDVKLLVSELLEKGILVKISD